MGGVRGRHGTRAGMAGALLCSVALLLSGCGVLDTKDDRRYAEKLADEHYPGMLRVIGARTLFPQSEGSEISFAVADDPDAVVRFRIDAGKGTCNSHPCLGVLDEAVTRGRAEARRLRLMIRSFAACGYEVIAYEPASGAPWIVGSLTNDTVKATLADIGACVRTWRQAEARTDAAAGARGAAVNLASPSVAEGRPVGKASEPTAVRLTDTRLRASLQSRPYYAVGYAAADGTLDTSGSARIVRPFDVQEKFAANVRRSVRERLRAAHPRVQMSTYQGVWRLEPGTVDRLTGYVLYCEEPDGDLTCLGDMAVEVTTDVRGTPVGEPRPVGSVREGRGPLRLPAR
ncbi:SCO7460 family lipoprotein [Streptomyces sp. NPDC002530]